MEKIIKKYWLMLFTFLCFQVYFYIPAKGQQILHCNISQDISRLGLKPICRLDSSIQLNLVIGLPLRNKEILENLYNQIYDPASPNYHKYLSYEQFTQNFGPTESDYQSVENFVKSYGLKITRTQHHFRLHPSVSTIYRTFKRYPL